MSGAFIATLKTREVRHRHSRTKKWHHNQKYFPTPEYLCGGIFDMIDNLYKLSCIYKKISFLCVSGC